MFYNHDRINDDNFITTRKVVLMENYIIVRIIKIIFSWLRRIKRKAKLVIPVLIIMLICGIGFLYKNNAFDKVLSGSVTSVAKKKAKQVAHKKKKVKKSGVCYEVLGKAKFTIKEKDGINYGGLDSLGRPTYATAKITKAIIDREKTENRQPIDVDPSGWPSHNPKKKIINSDGSVYNGYFYNRSHMIADSLGGDAIVENLITGTRSQNVGGIDHNGGMAYMENKIRDYFKHHDGYVYYTVQNEYKDDELIPRYSIVNAKSSDGVIDECVKVLNVAHGYTIDYITGNIK